MNAVNPLFNGILAGINPHVATDSAHQRELDESAEWQDWKDKRLAYWTRRYYEDGDFADAICSIYDGVEKASAMWKAFNDGRSLDGIKLSREIMEKAAEGFAASKVAMEERFNEFAKKENLALIRARQRGKVPVGYDDE